MNKKISIIVATYNADNTIKRCIDSIVCQKSNEIELLVMDGRSQDQTMNILESYGNMIFLSQNLIEACTMLGIKLCKWRMANGLCF